MKNCKWIALIFAFTMLSCSEDEAKNVGSVAEGGGPKIEDATKIEFVSDVSWLKEHFSFLDQASIPWVWGTLLFTQDINGVDVPVLFDTSAPPSLKVDVKVEVAGSAALGSRSKLTILDKKDVDLSLFQISAIVSVGDSTAEYEKIPDSVPLVGGKTVIPMRFMQTVADFDWSTAGATIKDQFSAALKGGNLADVVAAAGGALPIPWLDCETVKFTIKYKGTATEEDKYQIETTKYMAADPAVTIKLLEALAEGAGPTIEAQTGFPVAPIVTALKGLTIPTCTEVTDAQKALFD